MNSKPCTRQDLAAYLVRSKDYAVKDDGTVDLDNYLGETDLDPEAVDEYHCLRCLDYWSVINRYDPAERTLAWEAALAHLTADDLMVEQRRAA